MYRNKTWEDCLEDRIDFVCHSEDSLWGNFSLLTSLCLHLLLHDCPLILYRFIYSLRSLSWFSNPLANMFQLMSKGVEWLVSCLLSSPNMKIWRQILHDMSHSCQVIVFLFLCCWCFSWSHACLRFCYKTHPLIFFSSRQNSIETMTIWICIAWCMERDTCSSCVSRVILLDIHSLLFLSKCPLMCLCLWIQNSTWNSCSLF